MSMAGAGLSLPPLADSAPDQPVTPAYPPHLTLPVVTEKQSPPSPAPRSPRSPRASVLVSQRNKRLHLSSPSVRAPLQMGCGLAAACLLALCPRSAAAFQDKGEWIAITVALALEANVGATSRKAALRALGTAAGGAMGAFVVASTFASSAASASNQTVKVAVMTTLVAVCGAIAQAVRVHDPSRDYAYSITLVTLVLTSIGGSRASTLSASLEAVGWRLATIACGGAVALAVSNVVIPEYASHSARATLHRVLLDASSLLSSVVDEYLHSGADGAVRGFSSASGADGGLYGKHAALHTLEARLARDLDRFGTLLTQAREEKRLKVISLASTLPLHKFTQAGAAARSVFTGAVALLHGMESGLHLCALCCAHADAIRAARKQLSLCYIELAAVTGNPSLGSKRAREAMADLEASVEELAEDVTREAGWSSMVAGAGDATLRHNVQALGAVCFALGDAARQAAHILHAVELDETAEGSSSASQQVMVAAPGGAVHASGGGGMGAALRSAAHAMDAALHSHLAHTHAPRVLSRKGSAEEGGSAQRKGSGFGSMMRTLSFA